MAAFLITGAGAAGIAQPIDAQLAAPPLAVRAATIRVVLPPPAAVTPVVHREASRPGFTPHPLAPATSAEAATLVAAQPETAPVPSGLVPAATDSAPQHRSAPLRMAPPPEQIAASQTPGAIQRSRAQSTPRPADETTALAASRGLGPAEYAAALRKLSASPAPKPIPMVDAESRAALARMNGDDDFAPSTTDRMDALQPARASDRALIAMAPQRAARPSAAPIRMQPDADEDDETIGRYRRTAQGLAFDVATSVNGRSVGAVPLLIRDGENISIRLADLLAAVRPAIDPALYDKLASSQGAQSYMTFNALREAGLAVRFNDKDRLILGSR